MITPDVNNVPSCSPFPPWLHVALLLYSMQGNYWRLYLTPTCFCWEPRKKQNCSFVSFSIILRITKISQFHGVLFTVYSERRNFFSLPKILYGLLAIERWGFWGGSRATRVEYLRPRDPLFFENIFGRNILLLGWLLGFCFTAEMPGMSMWLCCIAPEHIFCFRIYLICVQATWLFPC